MKIMNYSEILKKMREEKALSNIDMGKILGISDSMYSRYEKQNQIIPVKYLDTLSKFFKVSIDYLLGITNIKEYKKSGTINLEKSVVRLKEFRKENNLTQIELAKILNVANGTIANYERARNVIATPFLYEICSKYSISADYLLGKIDSPKYLK